MPRGDKTGPMGDGAMTGRGLGICAGNDSPGSMNQSFRRGSGRGRNFGRGFQGGGGGRNRHQNFAGGFAGMNQRNINQSVPVEEIVPSSQMDELKYLKEQAGQLKETLKSLKLQVNSIEQEIENKNINQNNLSEGTKE